MYWHILCTVGHKLSMYVSCVAHNPISIDTDYVCKKICNTVGLAVQTLCVYLSLTPLPPPRYHILRRNPKSLTRG
jgi:hypothetical protein